MRPTLLEARRACRRPHPTALLGLGVALALALASHPRTMAPLASKPEAPLAEPLGTGSRVGARCTLENHTFGAAGDDIWILPPSRQVLPFDLALHGYPESHARHHRVVVRVTCTAYSSTPDQTDSTPFITASMQRVQPGIIALSRDLLRRYTPGAPFDFGDYVEIIGLGVFRVEDTMHRRWRRRLDLWVESRAEAWRWGRREMLIGLVDPAAEVELFERSPVEARPPVLEVELHAPPADGVDPAAANLEPATG